jgi:hypothetical protein
LRTDTIASIVTHTDPLLKLEPQKQPGNRAPYSPLAHRYQAKLFNLTGLPELSEETIKVFWELRHLTAIKESVSIMGLDQEFASFLPAIERLERRIIKLLRLGRLDLPNENSLIYKLFGNAALIHILIFLRQVPVPLSMLTFSNFLSKQIRTLLETNNLLALQIQYPEMILWILMMGGIGGVWTLNQAWFANLLVDACLVSGVRPKTDIAFTLADFLWTDQYLDPLSSMGFWKKVAIAQGAKGRDRNYGHERDMVLQLQTLPL